MKARNILCTLLCATLLLMTFASAAVASGEPGTNVSGADIMQQHAAFPAFAGGNASGAGFAMWVILAIALCLVAAFVIFRRRIIKSVPKVVTVVIIIVLAVAVMLPAAGIIINAGNSNNSAGETSVVSFETNGGSDVPAEEVVSGGTLSDVPTPVKTGFSFTGWYDDSGLTEPFYSDAPIIADKTLYASYEPTQADTRLYDDPDKHLEDCDPGFAFSVVSESEITSENLSDYILATAYIGHMPELKVSKDNDVYTISPETPYQEGGHYRFELLDGGISFKDESDGVRTLDFRISKEKTSVVELKDDIIYVSWPDVITLGDEAYYVPVELGIKAGDTVCFWNGEIDGDTRFFNVLEAGDSETVDDRDMSLLTVSESLYSDVLDKLNVHFNDGILSSGYINGIDTDKLSSDAEDSEGTRQMTALLACAISQSPTFQGMLSGNTGPKADALALSVTTTENQSDGDGFAPIEENEGDKVYFPVDFLTENLLDNLSVTAYVTTAQNSNFYNAGPDDWTVLSLNFAYHTVIKDKVDLKISFTVKECIKSTAQGDAWMEDDEYTIEDFFSSDIIPDMSFDFAINNYSQTDTDLTVLIKSHDASDDDYIDITGELEDITKSGSGDDAASFLEEVLGNKGDDYIPLLDVPLITLTYPIIEECPVLQLNVNLNFVVKVNFAAGISAHSTLMAAKQVGIAGDTREGADSYENTLVGNNRYSFDFYCAGYAGLKAGLKLSMSLSVYGLKDLGEIGVSGEVGAYLDLYGFMHLGIDKPLQYSDNKEVSLQGGLYMEVGIYVEVKVFAKSTWFKAKASAGLYDTKIPLLEIGNQYVLLNFTDSGGSVIMNQENFPLYGAAGLLDADYVDLKTGRVVSSSEIDAAHMSQIISDFCVQFSSPYFQYDDSDHSFSVLKDNFGTYYDSFPDVSANTKRLDTTVYVYYTGGNLAFSNQQGGDTMKEIDLTWIDSSINVADYNGIDAVKATYTADIDGSLRQVAEKWVPLGDIPGSIDFGAYVNGCRFVDYTNDPTQPIYEDTTYTIHLKKYERLVSYLTYHGGSWHFDVYAVRIGDVPVIPEGYDSPGDGIDFTGWIGRPGSSGNGTGLTNEIGPIEYDIAYIDIDSSNNISIWNPSGDYVYTDLDTTEPLYSISGTYDECCNEFRSHMFQGVSLNKCSQYLYEAQYDGGPYTVSLVYPAMSYKYCGEQEDFSSSTYTIEAGFNDPVDIERVISYPGFELPVWDNNGDGIEDYSTFAEFPGITHDMTLTAIFRQRTYTVTVLDRNGNVDETLSVNCGDLPDILKTVPESQDNGGNPFAYWALSKSGGEFTEWNSSIDSGVFDDWTLKPVFEQAYEITFDYAGGSHDGNSSQTIMLTPGTYYIDDLMDYYPEKAADERNTYVFGGWSCGNSFTVSENRTITAKYNATPIIYTTEFNTAVGSFSNGKTNDSYTGGYDGTQAYIESFLAQNAVLEPVSTESESYTFEDWEKITLSDTHIRYEAQWKGDSVNYTVTFDAGDGSFTNGDSRKTVELPYGTSAAFSTVTADIVTPEIEGYAYELTGWKDQDDNIYGPDDKFTIQGDTNFTAIYEKGGQIQYTITLDAAGGTFAGGETELEYSGFYGDPTGIEASQPTRTSSDRYDYTFDGWSDPIPDVFAGTAVITANWIETDRDYSVTFDANGGTFDGGMDSIVDTYHYNDTVTAPDDPSRTEDADYTYEFSGWNPDISPVTGDCVYKASWKASLKAGISTTGIIVSDGMNSEDINCSGALVQGYTYGLQDFNTSEGTVQAPVLTITGDGLTFSGSNGSVYVDIASGCSSVTFRNLSLAGPHPYRMAGILVIPDISEDSVTINISGNCEIINESDRMDAVFAMRPIVLKGSGTGSSSLDIGSTGSDALYSPGFEAGDLTLSIDATAGSDLYMSTYALTGEGIGDNPLWRFVDCDITASGMGALGVCGSVSVEGSSTVNLISRDNNKAVLQVFGEGSSGYLEFVDFSGEFNAFYQDSNADGPAVQATTGITFSSDVSAYDTGGAEISICETVFDNMSVYYTFAVGPSPQSRVHVVPY